MIQSLIVVFTSSKEKMNNTKDNVSELIKKVVIKVVISPNIWIISGKIGVSWNLWQVKYWEPEGGVVINKEEDCMIDSSDEEEEEKNKNVCLIQIKYIMKII